MKPAYRSFLPTFAFTALLGLFFAQVEIQIEGTAGWAVNLPTWRIEKHWLLDIFWGGRAMTGYHAWVFPFIAMFFHFPFVMMQTWSTKLECRAIANIITFWILEDFLWFILNPGYGLEHFSSRDVPWHVHWLLGLPTDYWIGSIMAIILYTVSYKNHAQQTARQTH
ncbi:hypothetical protein [Undibacterium sp. TS12]|uniref:hypothetical protein n=1 Tax=Undibacterium sp. TS12 TaxID=2908202 RepID=UPI001F4CBA2A|nr:hypothetical protein [Undibacterium sp. TS12]MCH8619238.1 hypothetical protein [Undibacterium sp. TS12]